MTNVFHIRLVLHRLSVAASIRVPTSAIARRSILPPYAFAEPCMMQTPSIPKQHITIQLTSLVPRLDGRFAPASYLSRYLPKQTWQVVPFPWQFYLLLIKNTFHQVRIRRNHTRNNDKLSHYYRCQDGYQALFVLSWRNF